MLLLFFNITLSDIINQLIYFYATLAGPKCSITGFDKLNDTSQISTTCTNLFVVIAIPLRSLYQSNESITGSVQNMVSEVDSKVMNTYKVSKNNFNIHKKIKLQKFRKVKFTKISDEYKDSRLGQ